MQNNNTNNLSYSLYNDPHQINTILPSQSTLIQPNFVNTLNSNNIQIQPQNQTQQPRTSNQPLHINTSPIHQKVIGQRDVTLEDLIFQDLIFQDLIHQNLTYEIIEITENIDTINQPTDLSHYTYCEHIRIQSLQSSVILPDNITKLTVNHMMPSAQIPQAKGLKEIHIGTLYTGSRINIAHLPIEKHSIAIKQVDAEIFGNGKNCQIF